MDTDGNVVGAGDFAVQAEQALTNLHHVLRELGADWPDVVKFGWHLVDVGTGLPAVRAAITKIVLPSLGEQRPASTLVQVAGLFMPDLLVEVDAVVSLRD